MAHLVLVRTPGGGALRVGSVFPLTGDRTVIGRCPTNAAPGEAYLTVPTHAAARRHARIDRAGDGHTVEDLRSRSGTRVNGVATVGPTPLADGDVITVCDFAFAYVTADPVVRQSDTIAVNRSEGRH